MSRGAASTQRVRERALLIGLEAGDGDETKGDREELAALTHVAGADVVGHLWQRRERPDPKTYIGRGKIEEVRELAGELQVDLIVPNDDLTPAQARNVERETSIRVVDRSQLIMDIFAAQARSRQAKLQVELAQLQYVLPRLRRLWTHLDRYKGGLGMRGPGERQIETDRRIIQRRIGDLKKHLSVLDERKNRELSGRRKLFSIGLVGYTNAGKSTLLNRLTRSRVVTADRPFSTLDTRSRLWPLGGGLRALLSDTVGFIRDLPHHLIASFRATLAEAATADLLLHVIDGSHHAAAAHLQAVGRVLGEIGADGIPRILVVNKIDRVTNFMDVGVLEANHRPSVRVSAAEGTGLDELEEAVRSCVLETFVGVRLRLLAGRAGLLARLRSRGARVEETGLEDGWIEAEARVPRWEMGLLEAAAGRGDVELRELDERPG